VFGLASRENRAAQLEDAYRVNPCLPFAMLVSGPARRQEGKEGIKSR
jgi:hypothetical protein